MEQYKCVLKTFYNTDPASRGGTAAVSIFNANVKFYNIEFRGIFGVTGDVSIKGNGLTYRHFNTRTIHEAITSTSWLMRTLLRVYRTIFFTTQAVGIPVCYEVIDTAPTVMGFTIFILLRIGANTLYWHTKKGEVVLNGVPNSHYHTFSELQGYGFEKHGLNQDPVFLNSSIK